MRIVLNGEPKDVPGTPTVRELVEFLGLAGAACAVEINRQIVPRREHEQKRLAEGDLVEVVTLVGGG